MILKSGAFSTNKKPINDLRDLVKEVYHPPYEVEIYSHKIPELPSWLNKEYSYKDVKYNPFKIECNCDLFLSRSAFYPERDVRTVCIHLYGKIMFSAKKHIDQLTNILLENHFKYGVQHLHKFQTDGRTVYLGFSNNPDWIKVYQASEEWKEYSYSISEDRWAYRLFPDNAEVIKDYILSIVTKYKK